MPLPVNDHASSITATMTTTAAMNASVSMPDTRHMLRVYVDALPPDLFHQCRRSSTISIFAILDF